MRSTIVTAELMQIITVDCNTRGHIVREGKLAREALQGQGSLDRSLGNAYICSYSMFI